MKRKKKRAIYFYLHRIDYVLGIVRSEGMPAAKDSYGEALPEASKSFVKTRPGEMKYANLQLDVFLHQIHRKHCVTLSIYTNHRSFQNLD